MTDNIALFDLDGTLADYEGSLREKLHPMMGPDEIDIKGMNLWEADKLPHIHARMDAIRRVPGFWSELPRLQWGWDVLTIAAAVGFEIHILTKGPSSNPLAWAEKVEWVREHLHPDTQIHITENKAQVYGRVLVDDYKEYVDSWLHQRPRGISIVPYAADNPRVISYEDGLPQISDALQAAYDR